MALSLLTKYLLDREMVYKMLAAIIVASMFLPASVQVRVIQYQEVALRYTVEAGVTDFNTGEFDGEANATRVESNPRTSLQMLPSMASTHQQGKLLSFSRNQVTEVSGESAAL